MSKNTKIIHLYNVNGDIQACYFTDREDIDQIRKEFHDLWKQHVKGNIEYNDIDDTMKENGVYLTQAIQMDTGLE